MESSPPPQPEGSDPTESERRLTIHAACVECGFDQFGQPYGAKCPECGWMEPLQSGSETCLACNYLLTDLDFAANCPECGLSVATSRLRQPIGSDEFERWRWMRRALIELTVVIGIWVVMLAVLVINLMYAMNFGGTYSAWRGTFPLLGLFLIVESILCLTATLGLRRVGRSWVPQTKGTLNATMNKRIKWFHRIRFIRASGIVSLLSGFSVAQWLISQLFVMSPSGWFIGSYATAMVGAIFGFFARADILYSLASLFKDLGNGLMVGSQSWPWSGFNVLGGVVIAMVPLSCCCWWWWLYALTNWVGGFILMAMVILLLINLRATWIASIRIGRHLALMESNSR